MNIDEIIRKRRTIRNFKNEELDMETIKKLLDGARLAPSAANLQPIKYIIIITPQIRERIFENILWAKYIRPYGNPNKGHEPRAYIAVLIDKSIKQTGFEMLDIGLALENIILSALDKDIGACILGAFNKRRIMETLQIDVSKYDLYVILALGFSDQNVMAVEMSDSDAVEYYKNNDGILCVPKRRLKDIVVCTL